MVSIKSKSPVESVVILAKVIRADGKVEDLGIISEGYFTLWSKINRYILGRRSQATQGKE